MKNLSGNNKLIIKNTFYLYTRTFLVIIVNLFVSRIILDELGVTDFGIYTIVGGIVSFFGLFQSVMASAVSRFFTIEIGRNNIDRLNKYFKTVVIIYFGIAFLFLLIAETLGLWFLQNKIIIPPDRLNAALWVYQFSIITFVVSIFTVSYNAIIMSHEKFNVFALIGIAEVILKVLFVFILIYIEFDKLIFYSFSIFGITFFVFFMNYLYCRRNYIETRFSWYWNISMFKEMLSFSFWSLFGSISSVARNQGLSIILGMFFNPAINAARGISYQVNDGIMQLSHNFFAAVRPQITKHHARNDLNNMLSLVIGSSKYSFYLLMLISIPIILETPFLFKIWLINTPDETVLFTRLLVITSLIDVLAYPLITAINANGNIKWYQIITGSILIMTLPISYIFLYYGFPPVSVMYVSLVISIIAQCSRIVFVKYFFKISFSFYLKKIILNILLIFTISLIIPLIVVWLLPSDLYRFILTILISLINSFLIIYFIGFQKEERTFVKNLVKKYLHKKIK